jgi:transcriptional regulator with XRE-family HTH domain
MTMNIELHITQLRKARRLSQAQLARAARVSESTVSKLENGRLRPPSGSRTLRRLAKVLGRPAQKADELLEPVIAN